MQILNLMPAQFNNIRKGFTICPTANVNNSYPLTFRSKGDVFVRAIENNVPAANPKDLTQKIVSIFQNPVSSAPKGLELQVSPLTDKIVGFTKELTKGKKLKATKQFIHKNCKDYFYISLKEYKDNEVVNAFAIDLSSGNIIKLRQNGNIKFKEENLIPVEPDTAAYSDCCRHLQKYAEAICDGGDEDTITVLKAKQKSTKHAPHIITVEDLLSDEPLETPKAVKLSELQDPELASLTEPLKLPQENKKPESKKIKAKPNKTQPKQKVTDPQPINVDKKPIKVKIKQKRNFSPRKEITGDYSIDSNAVNEANVLPGTITTSTHTAKHIINAPAGKILPNLSRDLAELEQNIDEIALLLDRHRGSIDRIKRIKSVYEPIAYSADRKKTINFKLPDNNTLGVIHTKIGKRYIRIIFKDSSGNETHFLIEDNDRIVSNLNKKSPWTVPMKFRYMTQEQIDVSNIDKYIPFLNKEVTRYHKFLKENL